MNKSEHINELATALAVAQSELENASKNANNPHFKSKYADLAEVLNTVRPVFSVHGLSIVQMPSFESGTASVETILMHKSGQWLSNIASAPVGKQDAQGVGSVITYLRRYSVAAFAGIAQEDDDANASIGQSKAKTNAEVNTLFENAIKAIQTAETIEALQNHFKAAQSLCSNQIEINRVVSEKDTRKNTLTTNEGATK